jgi:hypothetical protein
MLNRRCKVSLALVFTLVTGVSASTAEQLLTIGGGYNPSGNQVSLEKNVAYYQRILPLLGLQDQPHHILFADGDDPEPDLQISEPQFAASETCHLLAQIFGSDRGIDNRYRNHELVGVKGPSSIKSIDEWFDAKREWTDDQRLIFYFTGHGGGGPKEKPRNTSLNLWNGETMLVDGLVKRLDRLPVTVPVVLVMVQCHSGGFADVIFSHGNMAEGLSPHPRCGFFATIPEQLAAGCTSDISEENYQEYSTYFWAAMSGQPRLGPAIERPDYNHDGKVSFNEAHAYVIINSPTIDLPVKTSDIFLRRYSVMDDDAADALSFASDYSEVVKSANVIDRAILDGLSVALKMTGESRMRTIKEEWRKLHERRKELEKKVVALRKDRDEQRKTLAKVLITHWPELSNPFHPLLRQLMADAADPIGEYLREQKTCKEFCRLIEEQKKNETDKLDIERQQAKIQRFIRTAENILLEHYLPQNADPTICSRYEALVALESGVFAHDVK